MLGELKTPNTFAINKNSAGFGFERVKGYSGDANGYASTKLNHRKSTTHMAEERKKEQDCEKGGGSLKRKKGPDPLTRPIGTGCHRVVVEKDSSTILVERPTMNDVLLGRGTPVIQFEGNVRFRNIVKSHRAEYSSIRQHAGKEKIARAIILQIGYNGGRFLIKTQSTPATGVTDEDMLNPGVWKIADVDTVLEKVKQALRARISSSNNTDSEAAPPNYYHDLPPHGSTTQQRVDNALQTPLPPSQLLPPTEPSQPSANRLMNLQHKRQKMIAELMATAHANGQSYLHPWLEYTMDALVGAQHNAHSSQIGEDSSNNFASSVPNASLQTFLSTTENGRPQLWPERQRPFNQHPQEATTSPNVPIQTPAEATAYARMIASARKK